ncbi:hypothetical protein EMPS_09184 [Entomortierella parvispora]|uniref:Uncharacterized protein n=1 Tax=Entomortierella parvispora TaxID=205924 RepID=A0A9P3M0C5_9FUNG|nr:hypothetical protein EMPS_09184 [Entomortierella parvispora]
MDVIIIPRPTTTTEVPKTTTTTAPSTTTTAAPPPTTRPATTTTTTIIVRTTTTTTTIPPAPTTTIAPSKPAVPTSAIHTTFSANTLTSKTLTTTSTSTTTTPPLLSRVTSSLFVTISMTSKTPATTLTTPASSSYATSSSAVMKSLLSSSSILSSFSSFVPDSIGSLTSSTGSSLVAPTNVKADPGSSGLPTSAIVGIAVAGVAFIGFFSTVFVMKARKRHHKALSQHDFDHLPIDHTPPAPLMSNAGYHPHNHHYQDHSDHDQHHEMEPMYHGSDYNHHYTSHHGDGQHQHPLQHHHQEPDSQGQGHSDPSQGQAQQVQPQSGLPDQGGAQQTLGHGFHQPGPTSSGGNQGLTNVGGGSQISPSTQPTGPPGGGAPAPPAVGGGLPPPAGPTVIPPPLLVNPVELRKATRPTSDQYTVLIPGSPTSSAGDWGGLVDMTSMPAEGSMTVGPLPLNNSGLDRFPSSATNRSGFNEALPAAPAPGEVSTGRDGLSAFHEYSSMAQNPPLRPIANVSTRPTFSGQGSQSGYVPPPLSSLSSPRIATIPAAAKRTTNAPQEGSSAAVGAIVSTGNVSDLNTFERRAPQFQDGSGGSGSLFDTSNFDPL